MTEEQIRALKATFPWKQRLLTIPHKQGGIVQMLDNKGQEVPLFTMLALIQALTERMAVQAAAPAQPSTTV
ncbi:hypothetical protein LP414_28020 [Polaromonas sp. P1(28)-13]|nr:hypothetical protein LP414_28020 [Polaromonas sp. P1(28)-13]